MLPVLCLNQISRLKQSDLLSGAKITSERQFICFCPPPVSAGAVSFRNHVKNIWFAQHNFQNFNCYFFSSIWHRVVLGLLPMWNCTMFTRVLLLIFQLAEKSWPCSKAADSLRFNENVWKWPLCQVSPNYNSLLASLQLTLYCLVLPKVSQTFLAVFCHILKKH